MSILKEIKKVAIDKGFIKRNLSVVAQEVEQIAKKGRVFELGGPSKIFSIKGKIPVYPFLNKIDTGNFSETTIWLKSSNEKDEIAYKKLAKKANKYIIEATNLNRIDDDVYDLFLSSHVIEHTANPILALKEWARVTKKEGALIIVFPEKSGTFDHKRPLTKIQHLLEDYAGNTKEDDSTHIQEILKYHDLERDSGILNKAELFLRLSQNKNNRSAHHHVFDLPLATQLVEQSGLKVIVAELSLPASIIILAKK